MLFHSLFAIILLVHVLIFDTDKDDGHQNHRRGPNPSTNRFYDLTSCLKTRLYTVLNKIAENIGKMKTKRNQCPSLTTRSRHQSTPKIIQRTLISALALQAVTATTTTTGKHQIITNFNTDSEPIGVDNRCTVCISHVSSDFVKPLSNSGRIIRGFAGSKTRIFWKQNNRHKDRHIKVELDRRPRSGPYL
jgi:hypothetical protein